MGRYSLTPLVEAMNIGPGESVCRALGVSGQSLTRYTVCGLEEATAERLAVRAGFHPSSIWPSILTDAIADLTRVCEAEDCAVEFVLKHKGAHRRFCSNTCRSRIARRRALQHEDVREKARIYQRQYHADERAAKARREARKAA